MGSCCLVSARILRLYFLFLSCFSDLDWKDWGIWWTPAISLSWNSNIYQPFMCLLYFCLALMKALSAWPCRVWAYTYQPASSMMKDRSVGRIHPHLYSLHTLSLCLLPFPASSWTTALIGTQGRKSWWLGDFLCELFFLFTGLSHLLVINPPKQLPHSFCPISCFLNDK